MVEEYRLVFRRSIVGIDGVHIPAERPRAYSISIDNIGSDMCPSYRTGIIRELFHRFLLEIEKEDDESVEKVDG